MRSVIRRITASDDSCVRGGLHGYEATGHAREKPICACEIGDLEIITKKKVEVSAISDAVGLRNNEFTYHGLRVKHIHRTQQCIEYYCKLRTRILQGTGKTKWGIVNKNYDCLSLRIMGNSIILPLAQSAMITRDPGSTATPIGL